MGTPKGTRAKGITLNSTDSVHVYSNSSNIWLQLRRDHPTVSDIRVTSFKAAVSLDSTQALALAAELLAVAAERQKSAQAGAVGKSGAKFPENHGKPWSDDEDKKLLSRFQSQVPLEEIAKKHKRGLGGIQSRLAKHGKIQPPSGTSE